MARGGPGVTEGRGAIRRKAGTLVRQVQAHPTLAKVNLDGRWHAHGCGRCGLRYADSCDDSLDDGVCASCRGGRPRPLWDRNSDPALCCLEESRLATVEQRRTYLLVGQSTWWICQVCKRTHPYNPKKESE